MQISVKKFEVHLGAPAFRQDDGSLRIWGGGNTLLIETGCTSTHRSLTSEEHQLIKNATLENLKIAEEKMKNANNQEFEHWYKCVEVCKGALLVDRGKAEWEWIPEEKRHIVKLLHND